MNEDWLYTLVYDVFSDSTKTVKLSPPDKLIRWLIIKFKGFVRICTDKVSKSVQVYVFLVLSSQVKARSIKVVITVSAVNVQQILKNMFHAQLRFMIKNL